MTTREDSSNRCAVRAVVAVVVAYAHANQLGPRLAGLPPAIARVIVVDNSPDDQVAIDEVSALGVVQVIRNRNRGGLAGAYNRALSLIASWTFLPKHVLFLDDDTDVGSLERFLASPETRATTTEFSVAAVAPLYVDPVTEMPGSPVRLQRWTWRSLPRNLTKSTEVSFLINSMSLWKYSALQKIGRYREELGVDHVDTDYCLRAQALGYRLILNPTVRFSHPIGSRRQYRFFGKTFQSGGHSPQRRHSIGRNTVLLARHYGSRWPGFALLCLARLGYEGLGIILAEQEKAAKLCGLLTGIGTGLLGRIPSIQDTSPRPQ
jgi:rhamnosyltransferase